MVLLRDLQNGCLNSLVIIESIVLHFRRVREVVNNSIQQQLAGRRQVIEDNATVLVASLTCTPLFLSADPRNTGVNALFSTLLRMAAYKGAVTLDQLVLIHIHFNNACCNVFRHTRIDEVDKVQ